MRLVHKVVSKGTWEIFQLHPPKTLQNFYITLPYSDKAGNVKILESLFFIQDIHAGTYLKMLE